MPWQGAAYVFSYQLAGAKDGERDPDFQMSRNLCLITSDLREATAAAVAAPVLQALPLSKVTFQETYRASDPKL